MDSDQLFTWEALSAMGGASLLTFFIVQYTKSLLDRIVPGLPTDLFAVAVAFAILAAAQLAQGTDPADWRVYALSLANAFLVAAAAGQISSKAASPPGEASETLNSSSSPTTSADPLAVTESRAAE